MVRAPPRSARADQPRFAFEIGRHRPDILDLHRPFGPDDLGMTTAGMGTEWSMPDHGKCGRYVVNRHDMKCLSIIQVQGAELGTTEPSCVRKQGLEHRLQLARRARDNTEDLRGCGLLLKRLSKLARTGLHLVEQPYVLDRNHRLISEGGDQFNLLVGERPY